MYYRVLFLDSMKIKRIIGLGYLYSRKRDTRILYVHHVRATRGYFERWHWAPVEKWKSSRRLNILRRTVLYETRETPRRARPATPLYSL